MPRVRRKKTSDVPTRIYSFRCLPPITEANRVEQQFRLAHQYRNTLVEIEHKLWDELRNVHLADPVVGEVLHSYEDAVGAVDAAYDELRAAKSGVADPDLTEERERLTHAKELRALFAEQLHEVKEDRAEHLQPGYRAARAHAKKSRKEARHAFIKQGLRTGTYERIENSIKQAAKATKRPLHFECYDGTGSIGTQLIATGRAGKGIYGMTVGELLSRQDTRLRLGGPGEADTHPRDEVQVCSSWEEAMRLPRNLRRHAARTYVDLRLGSDRRAPIFARFPVTLHRFLPKDAVIKWAYVVRRRIGRHYEWRFQLTIESEIFRPCQVPVGEGACAIDLGWRRLFDEDGNQNGLRVGYLVDETGCEREIRTPEDMVSRMAKVYDLAAIRDKEFETVRDRLVAWLRKHEMPTGLTERLTGLEQWRSPRKLQALVDAWTGIDWDAWRTARAAGKKCNPSDFGSKTNRVAGDKAILTVIQEWARQDRHLQNWQEHQRDRLIAHRRETWRVIAAELTRTYATILIEDGTNTSANREETMKLPDIPGWEQPAPEDGDPSEGREQRRMSRLAAPGELRVEIVKASAKNGAQVAVERTPQSTVECAWCGSIEEFNARSFLEHTCSGCRRTWDQDANASRNLLHRHGFGSGPVPPCGEEMPAAA
jgi:Putative transposase DNA-binding domain